MKKTKLLLTTLAMSIVLSSTALAGTWQPQDNGQWKYQNDDGSFATGWIADNDKSYFLDANGIMLTSTLTPDDYYVGADGACDKNLNVTYNEGTYQGILDSYTAKLKAATPILLEEYNREAGANTSGTYGLFDIAMNKTTKLFDLTLNGTTKMFDLSLYSGSGSQSEYMTWAGKLNDVYMIEAGIINDA